MADSPVDNELAPAAREAYTSEPHAPVEVGEHRLWNESMLGWWYDESNGIFGFHRVAHLPNDDQAQICQVILTRDGRRYRRNTSLPFDPSWRTDRWRVEGLETRFVDGRFQVDYESPDCTSHMVFHDLHEPVDAGKLWHAAGKATKKDSNKFFADRRHSGHAEMGCHITGEISIGGERVEIDALGFRDHSWNSIRDNPGMLSTRWVVGTCGPSLSFGLSFVSDVDGEVMRKGWVYRDGTLHGVKHFETVVALDMDGRSWTRGEAWAVLDDDSFIEWKSDDTFDGTIVNFDRWTTYETGIGATVDGRRGVMNIEISNNPHGGSGPLTNALRACATEGLSRRPLEFPRPEPKNV